jgi:hypothetical protein
MPYERAGASKTVEVRGGSRVVSVIEYRRYSLPSRVFFQFRRDAQPAQTAGQLDSISEQLSDRIEAVLNLANVTDVDYFQDTSQAGRLQDRMRTYYRTDDGLEGDVESDLAHFGPTFTRNQINDEIAALRSQGA